MTRTQELAYALVEEFFNRISVPANKMQSAMNYESQRNVALIHIQECTLTNPHELAWYAINKIISTDPYTYLECLYVDTHAEFSYNCEMEYPLPQDSYDGGQIEEH